MHKRYTFLSYNYNNVPSIAGLSEYKTVSCLNLLPSSIVFKMIQQVEVTPVAELLKAVKQSIYLIQLKSVVVNLMTVDLTIADLIVVDWTVAD